MIVITSPAKRQNYSPDWQSKYATISEVLPQTELIQQELKRLSVDKLKTLYHSSTDIAEENFERIKKWSPEHAAKNSKPAILSYAGDIFRQMTPKTYSEKEQEYAQKNVRIISGLYGMIRPYDLIQAYRLEMKAKLIVGKSKDLYEFWKPHLTNYLNKVLEEDKDKILINAASEESYKSIDLKQINARIVTVEFREERDSKLVNVAIFSKIARGMIIEFMIKNNVSNLKELENFNTKGYKFLKWEGDSLFFSRKPKQN